MISWFLFTCLLFLLFVDVIYVMFSVQLVSHIFVWCFVDFQFIFLPNSFSISLRLQFVAQDLHLPPDMSGSYGQTKSWKWRHRIDPNCPCFPSIRGTTRMSRFFLESTWHRVKSIRKVMFDSFALEVRLSKLVFTFSFVLKWFNKNE